jgi:hypothetical protein
MLVPEALLPEQHRELVRAAEPPEVRLMAAVLAEAILDLRRYEGDSRPRRRVLFRGALSWVASSDRTWPFSFENICSVFDLDPDELRRTLVRQRASCSNAGTVPHRAGLRRVNGSRTRTAPPTSRSRR